MALVLGWKSWKVSVAVGTGCQLYLELVASLGQDRARSSQA